jgi:RNA polymerase sigma-70 factor (ECF subfamily)
VLVERIRSNTTPAPTRAWFDALHDDLVGQPPDRAALARWASLVRRGARHREIASDVLASDAYGSAQTALLFRALLDRPADRASLCAWTAALGAGLAIQDAIASLCDCAEYKAAYPDPDAFVDSLYQRVLHRAPDPDGKAAWLAQLDHRSSTLSVIRGFLSSTEYCAQRVAELAVRMLGREPRPGEMSERVIALIQGAPLQQIALELAISAEYIARAERRGLAGDRARAGESDADVLALVATGDIETAIQRAMRRHGGAVYRYCRVALDDAALADDIHQQVFIEAYRDFARFARRSSVRTWLLGIARHRVLDAVKRRRRARSRLDTAASGVTELADPAPSAADQLDDAQLRAALTACMAHLDEPVRACVLLRYQQGLTFEDMAAICGEKAGTLQARVARALRRLRELIEAHVRSSDEA